jgi:hypothetical protein
VHNDSRKFFIFSVGAFSKHLYLAFRAGVAQVGRRLIWVAVFRADVLVLLGYQACFFLIAADFLVLVCYHLFPAALFPCLSFSGWSFQDCVN